MFKFPPFAGGVTPFRNGGSVPSIGGTVTLEAALADVARCERALEAARSVAKSTARHEGKSVRNLFSDGAFVARSSAERWCDTARAEGWKAGHNFLSDALNRANRPPDPADPFYHLAMRLQREGNRPLAEVRRYWDRLDAAGFSDATRAGDYEKAAQICIAGQREEESGRATGGRIIAAGRRARMSADAAGELPEPTGFAAKVIEAGKRRRGEI